MSKPRPTRPPSKIGRKRRTLGWTLLALGVGVSGVLLEFSSQQPQQPQTFTATETTFGFRVRPAWTYRQHPEGAAVSDMGVVAYSRDWLPTVQRRRLVVALWPIGLVLVVPAALFLRSASLARRRANTRRCSKCGYDLAGLGAGAACPECGKGAKATAKGMCAKCGYSLAGLAADAPCPECGKGAKATA